MYSNYICIIVISISGTIIIIHYMHSSYFRTQININFVVFVIVVSECAIWFAFKMYMILIDVCWHCTYLDLSMHVFSEHRVRSLKKCNHLKKIVKWHFLRH